MDPLTAVLIATLLNLFIGAAQHTECKDVGNVTVCHQTFGSVAKPQDVASNAH